MSSLGEHLHQPMFPGSFCLSLMLVRLHSTRMLLGVQAQLAIKCASNEKAEMSRAAPSTRMA